MTPEPTVDEHAAALGDALEDCLDELAAVNAVDRLFAGDHTLWRPDPAEVADRLGWLRSPAEMQERAGALSSFADGVVNHGFTHAVLMGMGGSSLFPEVVASVLGDGAGALELHVVDTTDPAAIARVEETLPLDATLFVAASKSGTTVETRSHLAYFWERIGRAEQFIAITDPGSPLATLAREREFRAVFENRPDIGGRYSALSHFGLVPAALVGANLDELLERAIEMLAECQRAAHENPGVRLGAFLGVAAGAGRDKLTLRFAGQIAPFGAWIEQLIAESTGKQGRGILPVDGEARRLPDEYAEDRLFVGLGVDVEPMSTAGHPAVAIAYRDPYDLGREVARWEVATAVAGRVLGINPFDQPDVQAAKDATARVLSEGLPEIPVDSLDGHLTQVRPGDYLAVQAFVDPGSEVVRELRTATDRLGERLGVAATLGIGPRYLHSTGQLHKGGPPTGVFVQVVGEDHEELEIPGAGYGFSRLKRAQAAGDYEALRSRGLRVARVALDDVLRV